MLPELFENLRLEPKYFEEFIAEILRKMHFLDVCVTGLSDDGGIDITAVKYEADIPVKFGFECKRYAKHRKIEPEKLRALLGAISLDQRATIGVLVTTSSFTKGCLELIAGHSQIDGKDFNGICKWLNDIRSGKYK